MISWITRMKGELAYVGSHLVQKDDFSKIVAWYLFHSWQTKGRSKQVKELIHFTTTNGNSFNIFSILLVIIWSSVNLKVYVACCKCVSLLHSWVTWYASCTISLPCTSLCGASSLHALLPWYPKSWNWVIKYQMWGAELAYYRLVSDGLPETWFLG